MIKVGIDSLAIYTSRYALNLATLAKVRGINPDKYYVGLGQHVMSVSPPGEDIVTMAANAAQVVLQDMNVNEIEMLLFATESSIDQSKAAGLYIHELLGLGARCRVIELKQACYSATAGLQLALPYLRENPNKKVLLIASDIARYGLNTSGESSQGSGAVAMVLSAYPRLLAIEPEFGVVTENVMDFWRPNYSHVALVDGKYSSKLYLMMLEKTWEQYRSISSRHFSDHSYFCYHTPVPRLVEKAHQHLMKVNEITYVTDDMTSEMTSNITANPIQYALAYGRLLGNSYSAALYISLASLFDKAKEDLTGKRIGFYSYGSGCVAEYFSGVVQPEYRDVLKTNYHDNLLATRTQLTYDEYEAFYHFNYAEDGSEQVIPTYHTGSFRLAKLQQHKRIYQKVDEQIGSQQVDEEMGSQQVDEQLGSQIKSHIESQLNLGLTYDNLSRPHDSNYSRPQGTAIQMFAPGKLILSGEHSVVYGQPALAMAVNRYVSATVTEDSIPQVLFDLSDLAHHSRLSVDALRRLKNKIKQKYYRFISGDYSIREVLQKPFELAQFTLGVLAESLNVSLPHGVKLHVQSNIPIGCGMGSSAATILSVMQAVSHYLQLPISKDTLFQLALEAENMQHGHSSGLDLHIAMNGGCLYMHGKKLETRSVPAMPMYLVNTGTPMTTTGQCVEKVADQFKSQQLQNDFAAVTYAMDNALKAQSWQAMHDAIRENHRLLVAIGVVPHPVQQFISHIESWGDSAKVCGAGAVSGESAGAVLVMSEKSAVISSLTSRFGYQVIPISGETRGVHAA